ncbi:MAG: hypothetical protein U0359_02185 [Byssovorax sp.]
MSKQDDYLQSQLPQILQPGEQVLFAAYMRRQPGLLMQLLLVGGLLLFMLTKAYFAVLTNRRLILIRTKMSFWTGGPKEMNLGIEQYDAAQIQKVTVSGFANNRSMTFHMADGSKQTLRISPWFKQISGTKAFFEQVPNLVSSGQLAQLAAQAGGAPQQMGQGGYAQQGMAPQQGFAPQGMGGGGFPPGARVNVAAPDGNRYPGTVVQEQGGQYLVTMPNGQQHWFPAQAVSPG